MEIQDPTLSEPIYGVGWGFLQTGKTDIKNIKNLTLWLQSMSAATSPPYVIFLAKN
jgi:hypothetical protein